MVALGGLLFLMSEVLLPANQVRTSPGMRRWPDKGAHKKTHPPSEDPTVGLCLGPYAGPRRVALSYERGTPVQTVLRRRLVELFPVREL